MVTYKTTQKEDESIAQEIVRDISVHIPDGVPEDKLAEALAKFDFGAMIASRLETVDIENVFPIEEIIDAASNRPISEIYTNEDVIEYVKQMDVEKVFDKDVLCKWATDNGFSKIEEKSDDAS